jgi:hypothetical protein
MGGDLHPGNALSRTFTWAGGRSGVIPGVELIIYDKTIVIQSARAEGEELETNILRVL